VAARGALIMNAAQAVGELQGDRVAASALTVGTF
jgi:hypothetical protein